MLALKPANRRIAVEPIASASSVASDRRLFLSRLRTARPNVVTTHPAAGTGDGRKRCAAPSGACRALCRTRAACAMAQRRAGQCPREAEAPTAPQMGHRYSRMCTYVHVRSWQARRVDLPRLAIRGCRHLSPREGWARASWKFEAGAVAAPRASRSGRVSHNRAWRDAKKSAVAMTVRSGARFANSASSSEMVPSAGSRCPEAADAHGVRSSRRPVAVDRGRGSAQLSH